MEAINLTFKDRLRSLRKEHDITQQMLADKLGVSRPLIGHWESGQKEPGLAVLIMISKIFGVSVDYLLGIDKLPNAMYPYIPVVKEAIFADITPEHLQTILRNHLQAVSR